MPLIVFGKIATIHPLDFKKRIMQTTTKPKGLAKIWREIKRPFKRMVIDPRFSASCDIKNIRELLGKKTSFPHPVGIVIAKQAKLGMGCKIWQNVTIGANSVEGARVGEYPTIGNNVLIYAGAVIVGGIEIGDNCIIGANSVVTKSFGANSIIAGVPATCRRICE